MSKFSKFVDIVQDNVYECIGEYYHIFVDYNEGSLASINVTVSPEDTDMPDINLETVFVSDNTIGFDTKLSFPDLEYTGDEYPDDIHYIVGKWYKLANGITRLNEIALNPDDFELEEDEEA